MSARQDAKRAVIDAALTVADDVAQGRMDPTQLDAIAAAECRDLFGHVAGPDDPLWELHVDVARQVLGVGGVPAAELAEWLAVARTTEGNSPESPDSSGPSWIEQALAAMDDDENGVAELGESDRSPDAVKG